MKDDEEPNKGEPASGTDDRVRYGHPPRHTQFRPGQSGNPNGRPKRRRSFQTDLAAALDAPDPQGAGKTFQQRISKNLVEEAAAGKASALKFLLPLLALDHGEAGEADPATTDLEQRLVADFTRRQQSPDSDSAAGGSDA